MKKISLVVFVLLMAVASHAQFLGTQSNNQTQSATNSLSTIEGVTNEMLAIISGGQNQARDWDAFRNLFLPSAQFIALDPKAQNGEFARAYSLEEFIRLIGPIYARDGFMEQANGLQIHEFNGIANVFQSFDAKNMKGTYQASGINSYQLVAQSNRWWIASTTWTNETATQKVPEVFKNSSSVPNAGNATPTGNSNSTKTTSPKKGKIILKNR